MKFSRKRWLCSGLVAAALVMLICGITILNHRLSPSAYLIYWAVCFLFTGLAIIFAFRDAVTVAQETTEEQRELLQSTIDEIKAEAVRRKIAEQENRRPT